MISFNQIESAVSSFGPAPGGQFCIVKETLAASESIESGIYISWMPHPSCKISAECSNEIRNRTGQCCRIGNSAVCICGHSLSNHERLKYKLNSFSYIKPPKCEKCRCAGFNYCPTRPEECGQWWLPRRKDFKRVAESMLPLNMLKFYVKYLYILENQIEPS